MKNKILTLRIEEELIQEAREKGLLNLSAFVRKCLVTFCKTHKAKEKEIEIDKQEEDESIKELMKALEEF